MVVEESSHMMEKKGQELGYVCKYCSKKFSCGKSLGGHMRSHVVSNSAESEQNVEASMKKISTFGVAGQQGITIRESKSKHAEFGSGQSVYGLRENPRKTWRAVYSTLPVLKEKVCKECGKGFQSLKALCGHMASHSEDMDLKEEDDSRTSENQKVELDSDSETEVEDMSLRIRAAKNKSYKKVVEKSPPFSLANNGSSSVSEIVGPEEEKAAMLLLMLKKGHWGNKGGVNSVEESSDNTYSVVLEAKSSSTEAGIAKDNSLNAEIAPTEKSGYVLAGCAKAVYLYGLPRYGTFGECKKPFKSDEGKVEEYSAAVGKRKYSSGKMMKNGTPNAISEKKSYECLNCKKTFKSFHALGGHQPCQNGGNAYYESSHESSENTLDDSIDYTATGKLVGSSSNTKSRAKSDAEKKVAPKKKKGLVCPFCNKVFKNGQALGGHKKTHLVGGNKGNSSQSPEAKPEVPDRDVPFPFDLNLPAPEAGEDEGHGQFFP